MKTQTTNKISGMEERLLNVNDAAQMLGISPKTLYDWARERKVSSIKLFGSLRFKLIGYPEAY